MGWRGCEITLRHSAEGWLVDPQDWGGGGGGETTKAEGEGHSDKGAVKDTRSDPEEKRHSPMRWACIRPLESRMQRRCQD